MTYNIDVFGFKVKGETPFIFLLIPVGLIIGYLAGCLILYSIVQLFGILEFSWINGFYTLVLIGTAKSIFGRSSDD